MYDIQTSDTFYGEKTYLQEKTIVDWATATFTCRQVRGQRYLIDGLENK